MRYKQYPSNLVGRDFVVGDIHGCRSVLERLLKKATFDPKVDRLFSVGDILDRGPESKECLDLLKESWCFLVQGNHERMFCNAVAKDTTWMTLEDYWNSKNGGMWTRKWFEEAAPELEYWSKHLEALPYVIAVTGPKPFWVVHAELWSYKCNVNEHNLATIVEDASDEELRIFQWSRMLERHKTIGRRTSLPGPIYCGHTPTPTPATHRLGHCNLDAGAGASGGLWRAWFGKPDPCLFLYCHTTGESFQENV